ncbi:hypothetical protein PICSAR110_00001 [Mycobacterium avium subsp. paratuberculosis]|nr:hypothetical protein PICSAR110_00001 [Mycobacterium avium subsp. paratuberculosis]CAG7419162.1 hypothetical protein PICSAR138_03381 [Mycobacterium avium subsp. paratuberculosis]
MQPVDVVLLETDLQRAGQQRGGRGLRVGFLGLGRLAAPGARFGGHRFGRRGGAVQRRYPGQRVVDDELVARRRQRPARRAGHPDADHVPAQPLAALGQRNVVGVAGDDHHMRQVGQPEHVLHCVDGQPDVGAVLAVGGGREQLHQVDRAGHQLAAIPGVDLGRPVGIGAGEHQRAERRREIQDRADVDRRLLEPLGELLEPLGLVPLERVPAVNLVVAGDHDVVEVEVDGHAGGNRFGHAFDHCRDRRPRVGIRAT